MFPASHVGITEFGGQGTPAADIELTILIPCLNEAETIGRCVRKALTFLKTADIAGEVLVSDNGSTDASVSIAKAFGARVVAAPIAGYGSALRCGIGDAKGRYVIMGDADDSYDFSDLNKFVETLRTGVQLVMGNRFKGGIERGAMPPLHRYLGNPVLSWVGRLFFQIPVGDFHCGLRGFDRQAILNLELNTTGMEFASEMVVSASLHGLTIREVPTKLAKDGRSRPPHLSTWRDGWRHLRFLMLHSPRWTFVYPGAAMVAAGLLLIAMLLPGRMPLWGAISLDIRSFLLGSLAVIIGVQSMTFGVIARRFSTIHGLLPNQPRTQRLLDAITMERMLLLAGLLAASGIGGVTYAVSIWAVHAFGAIGSSTLLRAMILSVSAIIAAVQLGFSAFLLGVLELRPGDARSRQARLQAVYTTG